MEKNSDFLRPPGVNSEEELKKLCVGCGQCAQVCNFKCIELVEEFSPAVARPQIYQQKAPCFLCMRCSDICPTNALNSVEMEEANMGKARIDMKKCLDYQESSGIMCWTCYEKCPIKAKAMELKYGYLPSIIEEGCVGCGVCEYVCPSKAISTISTRILNEQSK